MSRPETAKAKSRTDVASVRNSGMRPRGRPLGKLVVGKSLLAIEAPASSKVRDSGVRKVVDICPAEDDMPCLVTEYVAGRRVPRAEVERARRPEDNALSGLESVFDRALNSSWMAYQPIGHAATGSLFGYEALLRSDDPAPPDARCLFSMQPSDSGESTTSDASFVARPRSP